MPERRTPLYDIHLRSAREMVKGGGDYMFPISYSSPVEEHLNVRKNVGMQDLSSMGEMDIKGPGAERLIRRLLVNDIADMEPGQVRYSTMCNETGRHRRRHYRLQVRRRALYDRDQFRTTPENAPAGSAIMPPAPAPTSPTSPRPSRCSPFRDRSPATISKRWSRTSIWMPSSSFALPPPRSTASSCSSLVPATPASWAMSSTCRPSRHPCSGTTSCRSSRDFKLLPYGVGAMHSLRIEKACRSMVPTSAKTIRPSMPAWIAGSPSTNVTSSAGEALLRVQEQGLKQRWVGPDPAGRTVPAAVNDNVYSIGDMATFQEKIFSGSEAGELQRDICCPATPGWAHHQQRPRPFGGCRAGHGLHRYCALLARQQCDRGDQRPPCPRARHPHPLLRSPKRPHPRQGRRRRAKGKRLGPATAASAGGGTAMTGRLLAPL